MSRNQIQHLEAQIQAWRAQHPDQASQSQAYRNHLLDFTVSTMALEREPVDRTRLTELLKQRGL